MNDIRCARFQAFLACAAAFSFLAGGRLAAATADEEAEAVATALKAEDELTHIIEKTSAAFVFVGGGSGVVVSANGYILTNHHVAGDRKQWTVRIEGTGRLWVCDLVGTDPVGDLALLKVRDGKDMAFVEFGEISKVGVGQQVLAVGDPFKLADLDGPPSFSIGTVSALHRFQGNYSDAIQTDSAVNPGNSGGPLLTLEGKLIGITGQIMSRFGAKANSGIGYAIPVDQIQRFFPMLKKAEGRVVYHGTLPDGLTFSSRTDDTQQAVVEVVDGGSEAERAGFKANDRILSVDGRKIYNYARLVGIVRSYPENSVLDVQLERAGKIVPMRLTLPRMQLPPGPISLAPLGVKLESKPAEGLRVLSVEKGSAAEKSGLTLGDIITSVDGKPPTLETYEWLNTKKPGDQLDVRVRRGALQHSLVLTVESKK